MFFCNKLWQLNFSNLIISWYKDNKRNLPWRETADPYLIWLSEIILQQTRVEQGLPYYIKFSSIYPSIEMIFSLLNGPVTNAVLSFCIVCLIE